MPKPLIPLSVQSPGFLGLNTQNSGSVLPIGWATTLTNFVYDAIGRLSSRNGSRQQHATAVSGAGPIQSQFEFVTAGGASLHIFASGNKIYKLEGAAVTDITGTITTPTADNWQFANFNGTVVGYQEDHAPIEYSTGSGAFIDSTGTMYNGDMVLSAYGRTWTVYNNTLYYSDLLIHSYAGGSAGSFDLADYWPNGMDEAVAIADFNGYLVVFGKDSILVYSNPSDPTASMGITEGVSGTGCIARDSIQIIGKELVFLSSTGVRTLGRVIQEKSMPLGDISLHVRDELIGLAIQETTSNIKSVYSRDNGFYLLTFPGAETTYYFDLKFPNEDGTWKATKWSRAFNSLLYTRGLRLFLGTSNGFVSEYMGWVDETDYVGTNGSTYTCVYEGVWNDFGGEVASLIKIPKRVTALCAGLAGGTITLKWAFDYSDVWASTQLSYTDAARSRYGVSKFAVDTFAGRVDFEKATSPMSSAGQVLKFGLEIEVVDTNFALQRFDILSKIGRLGL